MYKSISELAQINPGNSLPSGVRPMDDISFIPMSDVSESGEWTGRQVRSLRSVSSGFTSFCNNDVLVAKITPCFENGKGTHVTNLVNGAGFGSTEFHVLRAYPGVSPRFIHHVSQSAQLRRAGEAHMVGSAGQKRVPREFFDVFKVPDFSHDEQIKISHVLDTLDTTIRQTEAIIEKLKQVKQGLLHDLLTRGIDANGELRPPQSEAPELYKESALGWIPREWEAKVLDQLVDSRRPIVYGILMPGQGCEGGVPVVKVKDIYGGSIQLDSLLLTTPEIDREYKRSRLQQGDLLFTIRGTVGRTAFVPESLENANITQDTARIGLRGVDARFVREYLEMDAPKRFIKTNTLGVAVQGINLGDVRKIPIAVPPVMEAEEIAEILDAHNTRMKKEQLQVQKLLLQKSGLMDDLLTGRVRVTPLLESAAA